MPSQRAAEPTLPPPDSTPVAADVALQSFKLRVLKLLLLFGTAAIGLIWPFEMYTGRLAPIDTVAYPVMVSVFITCLVAIYMRPRLLTIAEHLSFTTFALYATVQLQSIIFGLQHVTAVYSLATLAQWFPLVYTAAFIFFDTRRAVLTSIIIYLSFIIPIGVKLATGVPAFAVNDGYPILLNLLTSHPVYIITLSAIARLKANFIEAKVDAGTMRAAANIDYLTGVANRRAVAHELQRALALAHEARAPLSVILIDIDHFKQVNDSLGHDVGDQVLVDLAASLRGQLRQVDTLGRWGGEEFIVIAGQSRVADAAQLAERLRAHVAREALSGSTQITLSLGVSGSRPGDSPESLVKRADEALYLAKQRGRNRVEVQA